eukprot:m.452916 g.452916  ORF g.452916 m.452916 type:complete len:663 (+) comp20409_c0_seq1:165-2153(+)
MRRGLLFGAVAAGLLGGAAGQAASGTCSSFTSSFGDFSEVVGRWCFGGPAVSPVSGLSPEACEDFCADQATAGAGCCGYVQPTETCNFFPSGGVIVNAVLSANCDSGECESMAPESVCSDSGDPFAITPDLETTGLNREQCYDEFCNDAAATATVPGCCQFLISATRFGGVATFCSYTSNQQVAEAAILAVACDAPPTPTTTRSPTVSPTARPTRTPTVSTAAPTESPTFAPTEKPTTSPTGVPTTAPTSRPSDAPTEKPTTSPTDAPTEKPTTSPTATPTDAPTEKPTTSPTSVPTVEPTERPSTAPTASPTAQPTVAPNVAPSTASPTVQPSAAPSGSPTDEPTASPSRVPSRVPSTSPTAEPTAVPTVDPLVDDQNEDRTTATPGITTPTASPTESPTATCSYFTQTFTVLEPPVCTPPPQDEATTTAATTTGRRSKGTSGCGGGYKGSSRRGVTGFEEAFTALWGGQDAFIDQANYGLELSDFMADDVTVMTDWHEELQLWEHTVVVEYKPQLPISRTVLVQSGWNLEAESPHFVSVCGCGVNLTVSDTASAYMSGQDAGRKGSRCKGAFTRKSRKSKTQKKGGKSSPLSFSSTSIRVATSGLFAVIMVAIATTLEVNHVRRRSEYTKLDFDEDELLDENTPLLKNTLARVTEPTMLQ